jgi:putative component of toxin-antitoxin plasmid stabilization module
MEVYYTHEFERQFKKMNRFLRFRINKTVKNIKSKSGNVGDIIAGLPFFREVRINGKRLYFLVYSHISVVLIVALSNKKVQQATIKRILRELENYWEYVVKISTFLFFCF